MKKINILFLIIVLICSFMLFGCKNKVDLPDGLPTLEEAVTYSDAKLTEAIVGLTDEQLYALWGDPTTSLFAFGDVWLVHPETGAKIVVKYDKSDDDLIVKIAITGKSESTQSFKYTYHGEGYGGNFVITIHSDGTFSYTEGGDSDHVGSGTWTNNDKGLICLKENADKDGFVRTNYFTSFANLLIWVEEGSDNFKYVKLSAGNLFSQDATDIPEAPEVPKT